MLSNSKKMTKKAVLIGITYKGTMERSLHDVQNTKRVLEEKLGFASEHIQVMTDETSFPPTRKNLEYTLKAFAGEAQEGDTLYLHISGRGSFIRDFNGDESNRLDEVLLPSDFMRTGILTDDWIRKEFVGRIPKGVRVVCVLDCDFSGTMMDLPYNVQLSSLESPTPLPTAYRADEWQLTWTPLKEKPQSSVHADVVCFSACGDFQRTAVTRRDGVPQGVFTTCFLQTLGSDHLPSCTWKDVLKEVQCRMRMEGQRQTCQLSAGKEEHFDVPFFF